MLLELIDDILIDVLNLYLNIADIVNLDSSVTNIYRKSIQCLYPKIYANNFEKYFTHNRYQYIYREIIQWIIFKNICYNVMNINEWNTIVNYIKSKPMVIHDMFIDNTLNFVPILSLNDNNEIINFMVTNCIKLRSLIINNLGSWSTLTTDLLFASQHNICKIELRFIDNIDFINKLLINNIGVKSILLSDCNLCHKSIGIKHLEELELLELCRVNCSNIISPVNLKKIILNINTYVYIELPLKLIHLVNHTHYILTRIKYPDQINIKNLEIYEQFYINSSNILKFNKLEELSFVNVDLDGNDICKLISSCLNIKKIHFNKCRISICVENKINIVKNIVINTSITELIFEEMKFLNNKFFINLACRCNELTKLIIDMDYNVQLQNLSYIGIKYINYCHKLKFFKLNCISSDKLINTLTKIYSTNPNLKIMLNNNKFE